MTQPVQEPSPNRDISGLGWGERQLARRPAPATAATGSTTPWIILESLGQDVPDNTVKAMHATDAWYDPLLLTGDPDENVDTDDYFRISRQTEDAIDYWQLRTKKQGWYTWEMVTGWEEFSTPPGTPGYALMGVNFNTTGIPFNLDKNNREAKDWSTGAAGELEAATRLNMFRRMWLPASKDWPTFLRQTSGQERSATGHLKVWYEADSFGGSPDKTTYTIASI